MRSLYRRTRIIVLVINNILLSLMLILFLPGSVLDVILAIIGVNIAYFFSLLLIEWVWGDKEE